MNQIRQAIIEDSDAVFALTSRFATSFRPDANAFKASFNRLMLRHDALLLVAERSGTVVGYLLGFDHDSLFANGPVAWIEELMVREGQRRRGVGSRLVEGFERWARSRGGKLVALATRRAASFYGAMGYEESAVYFRKLF